MKDAKSLKLEGIQKVCREGNQTERLCLQTSVGDVNARDVLRS